jgi:hypothetical protein
VEFLFICENGEAIIHVEGGVKIEKGTFGPVFWPRSLPLQLARFPFLYSQKYENWMGWELNCKLSRKACITNKKRTWDILSPCCTPVV